MKGWYVPRHLKQAAGGVDPEKISYHRLPDCFTPAAESRKTQGRLLIGKSFSCDIYRKQYSLYRFLFFDCCYAINEGVS
jgi:hypothetical protein